jgi:hypothetical protein
MMCDFVGMSENTQEKSTERTKEEVKWNSERLQGKK